MDDTMMVFLNVTLFWKQLKYSTCMSQCSLKVFISVQFFSLWGLNEC